MSAAPRLILSVVALSLVACRPEHGEKNAGTSPPSTASQSEPAPPASAVARWTPEEIFRRALWRQPSPSDRILHAERREITAADNLGEIERWQWFLALHPGPDLLAALRDSTSFGLLPVAELRSWATEPAPPDWFPDANALTGFEKMQAPGAGLTMLYRASDNTLYATDSGRGFAAPAR